MKHNKYNILLRLLHWLMGILFFALIAAGFFMKHYMSGEQKWEVYALHKAMGITFLLLASLRFLVRILSKVPPLPDSLKQFERLLTGFVHYSLYVFMFAIPISGYIMSVSSGKEIKWFFDLMVPSLLSQNKQVALLAHEMHFWLAYTTLCFVGLHIAGFFKHLIFDKVNLLKRII
jgi:cytochrome b561